MQRVERPAFQAGPSGCESHHGCHLARVAQQQRHCVESADNAGANPAASTISGPQALIVKQRTFNPCNGEHYPGGSFFFPSRLIVGCLTLNQEIVGRSHAREPTSVGVTVTRLAYIQESGERNLHGRPSSAAVRLELLRSSIGRAARNIGLTAGSTPAEISEQSEIRTPISVLRRIILRK